jgi:hypothetical protein
MFKKMPGVMNASFPFKPIFVTPADKLFALKTGDELYIEPIDHEVAKDRRFAFDVSFDQPGVIECEPAIKTLHEMANCVDGIIGALGRFLP